MRIVIISLLFMALLSGCQQGNDNAWWQEHEDRQSRDLAVAYAINEPDGGNYAKAVMLTRASRLSAKEKKYRIGQLIIDSFEDPKSRRPPETLQQGLEMVEQAAVESGPPELYAPQQIRILFERGIGTPPDGIPIDHEVAACWRKLENGGKGDPAKCVALRRARLPKLSS